MSLRRLAAAVFAVCLGVTCPTQAAAPAADSGAARPTLPLSPANLDFEATDPSQDSGPVSAVWVPRKVHFEFKLGSCDRLHDLVKYMLLQLGARASDLTVTTGAQSCGSLLLSGADATFSVLMPVAAAGQQASGSTPVEAHWQTVEIRKTADYDYHAVPYGDLCYLLQNVSRDLLPLFATRNVKLIPRDFCEQHRIGLHAEVLKPLPAVATSR